MTKSPRQKVRITGPKCFAWGSFGLRPVNHRGQHDLLINVWTRTEPDGKVARYTTREKARAGLKPSRMVDDPII